MKKVLVTLAPGFEEIEMVTVVDILRRAGARVTVAGTEKGPIQGSRGMNILPDCFLSTTNAEDFDLVVLPGGQPGPSNLQKDSRVTTISRNMNAEGKQIAAICAAPIVLDSAGILEGRKTTSHPSVRDNLNSANYSEERVVVDGNIITSRSPGTAMEFAMKLVEVLFGKDRVNTVNNGVMARIK